MPRFFTSTTSWRAASTLRGVLTEEPSLDELARAAANGGRAALDQLLAAVRPEVLRLCARFLPYREDAEEACQDTLFAVARGIARFDGRSSFRTWLHRVAANRARSTYQALRRRHIESATAAPPELPDPRRTSVVAGTRLDLLDGLEAIGTDLAEPVALRDVLGLPYRDIATLLDLPEGTAKTRVREGRLRLRRHLGDGAV
jgi:RNA polymerase sigma factor (sigma-70 family)